jgi:hypothetical protein
MADQVADLRGERLAVWTLARLNDISTAGGSNADRLAFLRDTFDALLKDATLTKWERRAERGFNPEESEATDAYWQGVRAVCAELRAIPTETPLEWRTRVHNEVYGSAGAVPQLARELHIRLNVEIRRLGGTAPACDGPDCTICRSLAAGAVPQRSSCINCFSPFDREHIRHYYGANEVGPFCESCDRLVKVHTCFREDARR